MVSSEDTADEDMHNVGFATDRTHNYLRSSNHEHNNVIFYVVGEGHELHILVEAQFSKRHVFGKQPFEINVTGVPSEFMMKSVPLVHLDSWRYRMELDKPIDSNEGVQYEQRMVAVLNEYATKIGLMFSVEKTKIGNIDKRGITPHNRE